MDVPSWCVDTKALASPAREHAKRKGELHKPAPESQAGNLPEQESERNNALRSQGCVQGRVQEP